MRDKFSDVEFHEACTQLSRVVHVRETTALLAKLFADQLISTKENQGDLHDLPKSIPMLMLGYLNDLNRKQEGSFEDRDIHRVAKVVAWECVRQSFRPGAALLSTLEELLQDDHKILRYMEDDLQILRRQKPSKTHVRFSLDPLAEYLAGLRCVEKLAGDEEKWKEFLKQADEIESSETIADFLLAVRDCCATVESVPNWVSEELGKRAGLDPEALENARQRRTIRHLVGILRNSDLPPGTRSEVIGNLSRLGAKEAVPDLREALRSEDFEVRRSAARALGDLGGKEAVPDLREALRSNEDPDVRGNAAVALVQLEAKEAVPDLREALRSDYVRGAAVATLMELKPNEAVPDLRNALRSDLLRRRTEHALAKLAAMEPAAGLRDPRGLLADSAVSVIAETLLDRLEAEDAGPDPQGATLSSDEVPGEEEPNP